jgi:WD40 repeat protein
MIKQNKAATKFPRARYEGKIMKLAVNCTGLLELDSNVIHPFIKVHFIDIATGKYLAKSRPDDSSISNKENITFIQQNEQDLFVRSNRADFIPPFATRYCDFRVSGENRAEFYEGFWINENLEHIYSETTVIIFELLDYNPELILNDEPTLRDNLYPVAWAYLRPLGEALVHTSTKRLQLYRYKFSMSPTFYSDTKADLRTPLVFFDFNYPYHDEYNSFLEITITFVDPPVRERVQHPSLNAFEEEVGVRFLEVDPKEKRKGMIKHEIPLVEKQDVKDMKFREKLISWERGLGQPCLIPDKLIYRFDSEEKGCFAMKFSNKGRYLATACSSSDKKCLIKIFNIETGELAGIIGQHQGTAHEFRWSITDDLLISVGNDSLAKVWLASEFDKGIGVIEDYTENEKKLLLGILQHPSYVYSIEFLPEYANKLRINPVIATACFDGKVRIWILTIDEDNLKAMQAHCAAEISVDQIEPDLNESGHYLLTHNYPTSLAFDDTGRLYIGDSRGYVHVWDIIVNFD